MLRYVQYQLRHFLEVKELFYQYLFPIWLRRLNITRDEISEKLIELEPLFDKNVLRKFLLRHGKYCLVCENHEGKVVAVSLNSYLSKKEFQEEFIVWPKTFLLENTEENAATMYAKSLINLYGDGSVSRRCDGNILYFHSTITHPTYRHKRISNTLSLEATKFALENDLIVSESMIPTSMMQPEVVEDRLNKIGWEESKDVNVELLNCVESCGFLCQVFVVKGSAFCQKSKLWSLIYSVEMFYIVRKAYEEMFHFVKPDIHSFFIL